MATKIDLEEIGTYQESNIRMYDSRYDAAESSDFTVSRTNDYYWKCQRFGHSEHVVLAVLFNNSLYADCDCYDFQQYGKRFARACEHIWRIYRYEDVMVI